MTGGHFAIGAFVSALTSNQVIAFIVAVALCFVFTASGLGVVQEFFSSWALRPMLDIVSSFSFVDHFRTIVRGVIAGSYPIERRQIVPGRGRTHGGRVGTASP